MPNIFKRFLNPEADLYVFPQARDLQVEPPPPPPPPPSEDGEPDSAADAEERGGADPEGNEKPIPKEPEEGQDPVSFAQVQAEAIVREAKRQAEEEARQIREEALRSLDMELDRLRSAAREEGFRMGHEEGLSAGRSEAREELNRQGAEQIRAVQEFLTAAADTRDRILDESREELKDLAMTIAEKVIQVSLKNSSDILLRMVDAATDTHKRCEWAHIYVADCDVRGKAFTLPEMAGALKHISDRVRVIPMADDESGTCIVELPDVILDASVSTQLANIREVLASTGVD